MEYLIGVDIGTQGTKAIVFDENLTALGDGFEASELITPQTGTVYQDAGDILSSVQRALKAAVEKSGVQPKEIAAISVDGQMAGVMGIKKDGSAATYYDSWLDTRCGGYMKIMREKAGRRVTEITGGPVTYTHGPKMLWWMNECPGAFKEIYKFVLPHTYVVMRMCGLDGGQAYFDHTCLQYSGFGDNVKKEWSAELLGAFGMPAEKMARIISPFELVGKVTAEFARHSGLAEGIPVAAGGGDTAVSIFGAGMVKKGMVLDCAGTASVLCCAVEEYRPDTRFETMTMMRSPVDGVWFPLAYINGGGLCLRWIRDEFTGRPAATYDELMDEARDIPAGSEGILFVPHFSGRVLPQNPSIKGSFAGLDWKHTRGHLYRAVMEGIGYEYAYYLDVLRKLFPAEHFANLYVIGGGSRSRLFNQIKADILDMPVTASPVADAALAGSAVIAGVACGMYGDYRKLFGNTTTGGEKYRPDRERHETYMCYQKEYLKLLTALDGIYRSEVYGIE